MLSVSANSSGSRPRRKASILAKKRTREELAVVPEKKEPDSLLVLSSRVVARQCKKQRRKIPKEADKIIAEEEADLLDKLDCLHEKRDKHAKLLHAQLDTAVEDVLESFRLAGEPAGYCRICNDFYRERKENPCSVEGCQVHRKCPKCETKKKVYDYDSNEEDESGEEDETNSLVHIYSDWRDALEKEQHGFPSKSGFLKCWICQNNFCNRDYYQHYQGCRNKVKNHCGFRAFINGQKGHVCLPHHCGRELTKDERFYVCYDADGDVCNALCCRECVVICPGGCGNARCKSCVAQELCYRCEGDY